MNKTLFNGRKQFSVNDESGKLAAIRQVFYKKENLNSKITSSAKHLVSSFRDHACLSLIRKTVLKTYPFQLQMLRAF